MISYEPELESLRPRLGDAATDALVARERREIFSVYPELRILGWAGASLLAAAAGLFLRNHLDRLGPAVLTALITAAALGCYAFVWLRRARATIVDDYVLLLGALLVSADVAFIETQYELLDEHWQHHFLLVAILHAVAAYLFDSRLVLALAIVSLGGWLGAKSEEGPDSAIRLFSASLAVLIWRGVDRKLRASRSFARTFEHFAANYALIGAMSLTFDAGTVWLGCLLAVAIAAVVIWWGFRTRHEPFVLYAYVYAVIAVVVFLLDRLDNEGCAFFIISASMVAAIGGLAALHARFERR